MTTGLNGLSAGNPMTNIKELVGKYDVMLRGMTELKLEKIVFEIDYVKKYKPLFLGKRLTARALCELFLYRSFVASFGYQLFDTERERTQERSKDIIVFCGSYGKFIFEKRHGISLEEVLEEPIHEILNNRWQRYNQAADAEPGPRVFLATLCRLMRIRDRNMKSKLEEDFLEILQAVEQNARDIGLYHGPPSVV